MARLCPRSHKKFYEVELTERILRITRALDNNYRILLHWKAESLVAAKGEVTLSDEVLDSTSGVHYEDREVIKEIAAWATEMLLRKKTHDRYAPMVGTRFPETIQLNRPVPPKNILRIPGIPDLELEVPSRSVEFAVNGEVSSLLPTKGTTHIMFGSPDQNIFGSLCVPDGIDANEIVIRVRVSAK